MDFGIDEFIYVPKSTLNFGVRYMTGAKVSFGGKGFIGSFAESGDDSTPNILRGYTNGSYVYPDTRTNDDGQALNDGFTNNWYYVNPSQVTPAGNIAMTAYSAETADIATLEKKAKAGTGVEVVVTRDLGRLFGTNIRWGITAGVSLNDIHASEKEIDVVADITTLTDTYSLNGVTPPEAPYQAPSAPNYLQLKDEDGNPVFDADGTTPVYDYDNPIDTSIVIGNKPISREYGSALGQTGLVKTSFLLKGQYYTIRGGPTFYIPITERLRATISAGVAAVYAGTTFRVVSDFAAEDGYTVSQDIESDKDKILLGYYVDANMEYTFTDSTGLFMGAVYQQSGSYDQSVTDSTGGESLYTTRINLKQLQGLRAGMTYRF